LLLLLHADTSGSEAAACACDERGGSRGTKQSVQRLRSDNDDVPGLLSEEEEGDKRTDARRDKVNLSKSGGRQTPTASTDTKDPVLAAAMDRIERRYFGFAMNQPEKHSQARRIINELTKGASQDAVNIVKTVKRVCDVLDSLVATYDANGAMNLDSLHVPIVDQGKAERLLQSEVKSYSAYIKEAIDVKRRQQAIANERAAKMAAALIEEEEREQQRQEEKKLAKKQRKKARKQAEQALKSAKSEQKPQTEATVVENGMSAEEAKGKKPATALAQSPLVASKVSEDSEEDGTEVTVPVSSIYSLLSPDDSNNGVPFGEGLSKEKQPKTTPGSNNSTHASTSHLSAGKLRAEAERPHSSAGLSNQHSQTKDRQQQPLSKAQHPPTSQPANRDSAARVTQALGTARPALPSPQRPMQPSLTPLPTSLIPPPAGPVAPGPSQRPQASTLESQPRGPVGTPQQVQPNTPAVQVLRQLSVALQFPDRATLQQLIPSVSRWLNTRASRTGQPSHVEINQVRGFMCFISPCDVLSCTSKKDFSTPSQFFLHA
jgi:hypothetical protein